MLEIRELPVDATYLGLRAANSSEATALTFGSRRQWGAFSLTRKHDRKSARELTIRVAAESAAVAKKDTAAAAAYVSAIGALQVVTRSGVIVGSGAR